MADTNDLDLGDVTVEDVPKKPKTGKAPRARPKPGEEAAQQQRRLEQLNRIKLTDGKVTASFRVGPRTAPHQIRDLISARFGGRNPVGVQIEDDEVVSFDALWPSVANRDRTYLVLFNDAPAENTKPSTYATTAAASNEFRYPRPASITVEPIAYFQSPFPLKNGTPRQGRLAPNSIGKIKVLGKSGLSAEHALDGMHEYNWIWIIFWFHGNDQSRVKPKVFPPRAGNRAIGMLASRTPHRFNPIGITAARLVGIEDKDTLVVSGVDLIDGTPILDIKPYVSVYDSIPDATCADWIIAPSEIEEVEFTPEAELQLQTIAPSAVMLLKDSVRAKSTIIEVLKADPRSVYRKNKCGDEAFGFHVENLNIQCRVTENKAVVYNVELSTPDTVHPHEQAATDEPKR